MEYLTQIGTHPRVQWDNCLDYCLAGKDGTPAYKRRGKIIWKMKERKAWRNKVVMIAMIALVNLLAIAFLVFIFQESYPLVVYFICAYGVGSIAGFLSKVIILLIETDPFFVIVRHRNKRYI